MPAKTTLSLLSGLLVVVGLAACASPKGSDYFPLRDGLNWTYTIEAVVPGVGLHTGSVIKRVEGTERIGGEEYFKTVTVFQGVPGAEPRIYYSRKTRQGIFAISKTHPEEGEDLEFPFPIEVGTTWSKGKAGERSEFRAEAIETVYLPEKDYERCLKISVKASPDGDYLTGYEYRAPGIGMVKMVGETKSVKMEWRLTAFDR